MQHHLGLRTSRIDRATSAHTTTCKRCSASLAGHYLGRRLWGGSHVDVWECGCGRRRMIRREGAA